MHLKTEACALNRLKAGDWVSSLERHRDSQAVNEVPACRRGGSAGETSLTPSVLVDRAHSVKTAVLLNLKAGPCENMISTSHQPSPRGQLQAPLQDSCRSSNGRTRPWRASYRHLHTAIHPFHTHAPHSFAKPCTLHTLAYIHIPRSYMLFHTPYMHTWMHIGTLYTHTATPSLT